MRKHPVRRYVTVTHRGGGVFEFGSVAPVSYEQMRAVGRGNTRVVPAVWRVDPGTADPAQVWHLLDKPLRGGSAPA